MEKTLEIAIIGCGERGKATLRRWLQLPALRIAALCDTDPQALADAAALCPEPPETFTDWLECIAIYRYHLVLVCTDWQSHADIAIQAMELGQNVAVEIPAATSLDKCFEVKRTADTTGVYFTMLENCCFDPFHLASLQMVREGLFHVIFILDRWASLAHRLRWPIGFARPSAFRPESFLSVGRLTSWV